MAFPGLVRESCHQDSICVEPILARFYFATAIYGRPSGGESTLQLLNRCIVHPDQFIAPECVVRTR